MLMNCFAHITERITDVVGQNKIIPTRQTTMENYTGMGYKDSAKFTSLLRQQIEKYELIQFFLI